MSARRALVAPQTAYRSGRIAGRRCLGLSKHRQDYYDRHRKELERRNSTPLQEPLLLLRVTERVTERRSGRRLGPLTGIFWKRFFSRCQTTGGVECDQEHPPSNRKTRLPFTLLALALPAMNTAVSG